MSWNKEFDKNFKLKKEQEKKQAEAEKAQQAEKKQNTFYGDYKSKQQSAAQGNTLQRVVSDNPFTPVKTKVYQSYDDRKKTGNVFIPNTVLGQHTNGFSKQQLDDVKARQWKGSYGIIPPETRITSGDYAKGHKKAGFGKWLTDNIWAGINQASNGIYKTVDFIIPTPKDFGFDSNNPIDKFLNTGKGVTEGNIKAAAETNNAKGG